MHKVLILSLTMLANYAFAQTKSDQKEIKRKSLVFGLGLGAGTSTLNTKDTINNTFSTTLPNIKVGYMLTKRLALLALLPGANYKYNNKTRGFEAVILAGQYWLKTKWWILAGTGLTFDAPAFYTVEDPEKAGFYTGFPAITFATGYEIWQRRRFALDIQYRIFVGN